MRLEVFAFYFHNGMVLRSRITTLSMGFHLSHNSNIFYFSTKNNILFLKSIWVAYVDCFNKYKKNQENYLNWLELIHKYSSILEEMFKWFYVFLFGRLFGNFSFVHYHLFGFYVEDSVKFFPPILTTYLLHMERN